MAFRPSIARGLALSNYIGKLDMQNLKNAIRESLIYDFDNPDFWSDTHMWLWVNLGK